MQTTVFSNKNPSDNLLLSVWLICTVFIYVANIQYFPRSIFSQLINPYLYPPLIPILFYLSLFIILLMVLVSLYTWYCNQKISCIAAISLLALYTVSINNLPTKALKINSNKPNVIIIGIDSLRLNELNRQLTPNITKFLKKSTLFQHSISPLARTYPSLTSILTGLYPKFHGARYNLMPPEFVAKQHSLAWQLDKAGYTTILATDDRRFSTIDRDYGYQIIIGPKIGINDILIGSFNDFPQSNLIINSTPAKWLFPYNYTNRASDVTYYPLSFSNEISKQFNHLSTSPLFLTTHFTLTHWPYAFANTPPNLLKDKFSMKNKQNLYRQALSQVDSQFGKLMTTLNQKGYLNNAIIILMSDHGETLYETDSRITKTNNYQKPKTNHFAHYLSTKTDTELDKSAGHGSDLLSPKQFFTLLSFQIKKHGDILNKKSSFSTRVSLLDIKPTILSYLNIKPTIVLNGITLLPAILHNQKPIDDRFFFLESGMLPNTFLTKKAALIAAKKYFFVNPKTKQLQLKPSALSTLDKYKLYGVLWQNWLLALYPNDNAYIPVIVNLNNKQWSDELNSPFAQRSPAQLMLKKLKSFYFAHQQIQILN